MNKEPKYFKLIFLLLVCISIISCKKEEKLKEVLDTKKQEVKVNKIDEDFSVSFDLTSDKETQIMVLYKDIEYGKQKVDYTVYLPIGKGNNDISAAMFGDYIPGQLMIEFGRSKPTEFIFKSSKILYEDQVININKDNFEKYFYLNKYISYDKETGALKTKKIGKSLAPIATLKPSHFNKIFQLI